MLTTSRKQIGDFTKDSGRFKEMRMAKKGVKKLATMTQPPKGQGLLKPKMLGVHVSVIGKKSNKKRTMAKHTRSNHVAIQAFQED